MEAKKAQMKRIGIMAAVILLNIVFGCAAVRITSLSMDKAYNQTLEETSSGVYQMFYQKSYDHAEKENHVKNRAVISVQNMKEISLLEVLQVSDVAYIYDEAGTSSEDNGRLWTTFYGDGVYTVDLKYSEVLVDDERKTVVVRIPHPRLTSVSIEYENVDTVFRDKVLNGNTSAGVGAAQDDAKRAYNEIKSRMESSQLNYAAAEESAKELIISMVKNLNEEIPDLVVEVEFID
ncbi:MAG: DUF4230 domain-containing protein [Muribaculaceae bacterium]|nr:DUF4230 domain-containing protein [Roseburia sp.]MCM1432089.1 DUF4230 domain-containing protein [Muribaculaceae bacterium]MCM1492111.1 DUF4230 domain-containing protein [Muribaculaceae bacterium]